MSGTFGLFLYQLKQCEDSDGHTDEACARRAADRLETGKAPTEKECEALIRIRSNFPEDVAKTSSSTKGILISDDGESTLCDRP